MTWQFDERYKHETFALQTTSKSAFIRPRFNHGSEDSERVKFELVERPLKAAIQVQKAETF